MTKGMASGAGAPHRLGDRVRRTRSLQTLFVLLVSVFVIAPAHGGPPFETDDPGVLSQYTGEAYLFSSGMRSTGDTSLGAAPAVEVNYSFAANTFAHLVVPASYNDPAGRGSAYGPGNVELGFKWRLLSQDVAGIDVAIFPLAELPSGSARRGLGSHRASYFLPLWLQKDFGPWTIYGGGGRWFEHDQGSRDWWFSGVLVQRQLTPHLYLGGELVHSTPNVPGGPSATGFNLGGGYTFSTPWQVLFSAGRNLTDVADNRFSFYLALYRTF